MTPSLQDLDGECWGDPPADATILATSVYLLRRKPIESLTIEDLRTLVGQQLSLDILVPVALERLERHPFCYGGLYPGDLLASVLWIDPSFWEDHPELHKRTSAVLDRLTVLPDLVVKLSGRLIEAAEDFPG